MACGPVREAIGVFQDEPSLGAAVDDLLMSGFDRSDISVLVGRRPLGREFGAAPGHAPGHAAVWAYEPETPSTAYVGNDARTQAKAAIVAGLGYVGAMAAVYGVISSGGTVTTAAVGAGTAGLLGGLVGGAISLMLDRRHAEYVNQQLACGGLRLWVQTVDRDRETRACHILKRQAAREVHVQEAVPAGRIFSTA